MNRRSFLTKTAIGITAAIVAPTALLPVEKVKLTELNIQQLLNKAKVGDKVVIPNGDYEIRNPIMMREGISITGTWETKLHAYPTVEFRNCKDCTITNMAIICHPDSTGSKRPAVLLTYDPEYVTLSNLLSI